MEAERSGLAPLFVNPLPLGSVKLGEMQALTMMELGVGMLNPPGLGAGCA